MVSGWKICNLNTGTGGMECSVVLFKPRIHLFACTHPSVTNSLVVSKPFELWILVAYTHQSPAWSFKHVWIRIPCLSTNISLQPCHQSPVLCSNTFEFWFLSVYMHLSTALCFKHGCLWLLVYVPSRPHQNEILRFLRFVFFTDFASSNFLLARTPLNSRL